ncbi:hypothetical protein ACS0TY_010125 [Phlomoides rotata]
MIHIWNCSVSSLAWFMSNQETSFVTIGQRVLARPLKQWSRFFLKLDKQFCGVCKGLLLPVILTIQLLV